MDIEVRLAEKSDLDIIHEILNELHSCDFEKRKKQFANAVKSGCSDYLLAISEKKVIGYLNIWHLPDIVDGGGLGLLMDIYVAPEYRSHGVGALLTESAIDIGKKKGVDKFFAWMNPDNGAAFALLKKLGFASQSLMMEHK
jgi:ribosomal protein S18 acetylase RimI-like enzyme